MSMNGSSGETRSRQPFHAGLQGEYAAGLRLFREFLFRQMQPRRGDIESIEIAAAEGAAGDAACGNGDDGVDGAVGRKADQRTAFPSRVPDDSLFASTVAPSGKPRLSGLAKTRLFEIAPSSRSKS